MLGLTKKVKLLLLFSSTTGLFLTVRPRSLLFSLMRVVNFLCLFIYGVTWGVRLLDIKEVF